MPLLSELREFKASFANIGGQKANLAAKKIPMNDLKLPETEAASMTESTAVPDTGTGIDDFNFSDLINALPGDLSVPDIAGQPAEGDGQSADGAPDLPADNTAAPDTDDLNLPDELLSDLSNELEPIPPADPSEIDNSSGLDNLDNLEKFNFPEAADESANVPELPAEPVLTDTSAEAEIDGPLDLSVFDDLGDFANLSASNDLDLPAEPAPASGGDTPETGAPDIPEQTAPDLGDLDSFADFNLPEEPAATVGGDTPEIGAPDIPEQTAPDLGDLDSFADFDLPEEPAAAVGGDTPETGAPDIPEQTAPDLGDLDSFADFDLPEEPAATAGSDTPEIGELDIPEQTAPDLGDLDSFADFDLPEEPAPAGDLNAGSGLDDLGLPEEPAPAGGSETDGGSETASVSETDGGSVTDDDSGMPEIGELDIPEQTAPDLGDLDSFADFDLPEEPAAAAGDETAGSKTPDLGDLSAPDGLAASDDPGLPDETQSAGDEGPLDLGNLDEQISADGLVETASGDAYESFDPSGGVGWGKETGEAGADNADSLDDIDDFSFPDLDAISESPKDKMAPAATTGKTRRRGKKKRELPFSEREDEIELNNNELRYLQQTLSGYPLNLRIACEEIIAEQDVRPEQMVRLIRNLIRGAPARETAALASEILERPVVVPRGFEKSSVEALEAEKGSFTYIFFHNFLPMLRLVTLILIVLASALYLAYKFVYIPLKAESIYKKGYERIPEGEYQRANERFEDASIIHRKRIWYFRYADAFTKERQYIYAEQKYDELLRYYPRDKQGVLAYAELETKYLRNYAKADSLLRHQILDYNPNDPHALLALGDNSLAWGEIDPSKYEDARFSYARLLDMYGWRPDIMERMMKYFIRTDNLKEVLPIWQWFDANHKERPLGADTLSELGGYLLDKQLEKVKGVPNEYVALIDGVRDILLRAVEQDPSLPEPHYHLARYYKNLDNSHEERVTLEIAIREFEKAEEGSLRRLTYHIDARQRYADNLIDSREFMHAQEQLQKGINLYEDAISRRLLSSSPQYGRLYAGLGDLEYFTKEGNKEAALRYYNLAQQNGWAPPEMRYRMGAAYYHLGSWRDALEHFFAASSNLPQNRRILFALGNTAMKRGDYFVAQGYYNRLLDILENQRARLPLLLPNDRPDYLELAERLMMARNNAGVANEMLAARTGNRVYQSRAMSLYAEAQRAWDSLTRDPNSMVRSGSTSLPFLNMWNILRPTKNYEPQMFTPIDREASESSRWEQLVLHQNKEQKTENKEQETENKEQ
ncbi:MAG: tetratricopeptide repeat protein [Treponema sp.]|jgi:hypothetical protein|nr:tetratricopeptide repeat protein [Treponema sp.]